MQRIVLLLILFCISSTMFSQMRMLPSELFLGQTRSSLKAKVTQKNVITLPATKEQATVYLYENEDFRSLVHPNDILSTSILCDASDTIRLIQIQFRSKDKNYFDSLRRYLPAEKTSLERYGMDRGNGQMQTFEDVLRYKKYYISMAVNGRGELYTNNTFDATNTVALTIAALNLMALRHL